MDHTEKNGKLLEVKDLHVSFFTPAGEVKAVGGISYDLNYGEVMGIVGESGSGKSVEAYSIIGLLQSPGKVIGGSITFEGEDVLAKSKEEMIAFRGSKVAMIFQNPMTCLNPVYTIGNIFITHNLGVVAEICDKVSVMYAGKIVEQGPVDDIFYQPGHPYTMGLLRSMPRVDAESYERLIPIEGTPVDMLNPPEGCPFAPRCEHAMKICLQKMPPYVELGNQHRSACWLRVQEQLEREKGEKKEVDGRE